MSSDHEYLTGRNYSCNNCGLQDISYGYIRGDDFLLDTFEPCDRCGSRDLAFLLSVPNIDRFSERFPYFDRGLGRTVTSKKHRLEVCREKNVVPIDGDIDFSPEMYRIEKKNREDDEIVAKMQDLADNHPGYAEYRKQKEQGWTPEFRHREQTAPGADPFNEEK